MQNVILRSRRQDCSWITGNPSIEDADSNRVSARLLIRVDAKDWLVVSGDGHFDGTDGGIRSLAAWRVQNLVTLDSLPPELRVKGLLQKILARRPLGEPVNLPAILAKP